MLIPNEIIDLGKGCQVVLKSIKFMFYGESNCYKVPKQYYKDFFLVTGEKHKCTFTKRPDFQHPNPVLKFSPLNGGAIKHYVSWCDTQKNTNCHLWHILAKMFNITWAEVYFFIFLFFFEQKFKPNFQHKKIVWMGEVQW